MPTARTKSATDLEFETSFAIIVLNQFVDAIGLCGKKGGLPPPTKPAQFQFPTGEPDRLSR
jgi:hypothetical protein